MKQRSLEITIAIFKLVGIIVKKGIISDLIFMFLILSKKYWCCCEVQDWTWVLIKSNHSLLRHRLIILCRLFLVFKIIVEAGGVTGLMALLLVDTGHTTHHTTWHTAWHTAPAATHTRVHTATTHTGATHATTTHTTESTGKVSCRTTLLLLLVGLFLWLILVQQLNGRRSQLHGLLIISGTSLTCLDFSLPLIRLF
jgi:hypothetical protein